MSDIKFCENNYDQGAKEVISKLESEGIDFEVEPCLGYCGDCVMGPFALVDDELIQSETSDELYNIIKNTIQ